MTLYAIKINNKYFKEYLYLEQKSNGRYAGNSPNVGLLEGGDIIDVILTNEPDRKETRRSLGNTIACIYEIEKMKCAKIEIIPINE